MNTKPLILLLVIGLGPIVWVSANASAQQKPDVEPTRQQATDALNKAVNFYRSKVGFEGGYLWRYSADLARGEGEGRAGRTTAWVQPPGTPTVGEAYLSAFLASGNPRLLEAANETGQALVRTQLRSGGWSYRIEFADDDRTRYAYRVDSANKNARNVTTLDDDNTQSALRFLMQLDLALKFQNATIHRTCKYALDSLIKAQYPCGAWPQRFGSFPDPKNFPIKKASLPDSWPRKFPPGNQYGSYYTFNDNVLADMIETMFRAHQIYDEQRYLEAALRGGDFIILAQLPDPQPAWAQQYDFQMQPAWARKFEPPSVTGGESQRVLQMLLELYQHTGDKKFLEPVPRALAYLKKSHLKDGRLARFYEMRTNRPLYFTMDYQLTYEDDDLPTHYGFIVSSRLKQIERAYRKLASDPYVPLLPSTRPKRIAMSPKLVNECQRVLREMDDRGAWVEPGRLSRYGRDDPTTQVITTRTLIHNLQILADYVSASSR